MIPLSIVGAIQTALLISLHEAGRSVIFEFGVLAFTLVLLVYCFAGHAADKGVVTAFESFFDDDPSRFYFFIWVVVIMVLTVAMLAAYVIIDID